MSYDSRVKASEEAQMKYKPKSVAALQIALGGKTNHIQWVCLRPLVSSSITPARWSMLGLKNDPRRQEPIFDNYLGAASLQAAIDPTAN